MSRPEIHIGVMIAHSPAADVERLTAFAGFVAHEGCRVLMEQTGAAWIVDLEEPTRLDGDDPRRPSDFLDDASLRMVEGPYDIVVVVTDVAVTSRRHRVVPGMASEVARIAILSTRRLRATPRGQSPRSLESEPVRHNATVLFLHLIGHMLGLAHGPGTMAPFVFDEGRTGVPRFETPDAELGRRVRRLEQRERRGGPWGDAVFYVVNAARHAGVLLRTVLRSRAPLLPLSLPGLVTAAVVPTFILIFTAEIWDAGLSMNPQTVWLFAIVAVLAATAYLIFALDLIFPRKERRVLTEYLAVANSAIVLITLFAMIGLLAMISLVALAIELFIFPPDLMVTWPTLSVGPVGLMDRVRIAVFIATLGSLTGALAGGLASRTVVRHLALFLDEP